MRPLRWVGARSYGIYLWQTPVIVLTSPQGPHGDSLLRDALQVAAIFAIAALSWKFVEEPIRHGAIGRFFARRRAVGWKWETFAPAMRGVIVATGVVLVLAVAGMAGLNSAGAEGERHPGRGSGRGGHDEAGAADPASRPPTRRKRPAKRSSTSATRPPRGSTRPNTCRSKASGSNAQLRRRRGQGSRTWRSPGARSIEERFEGQPNAQEVAEAWKAEGFKGCWVLALGTNEAADVAAGSNVGERERIDKMMAIIGNEPVLWVNVKSIVPTPAIPTRPKT